MKTITVKFMRADEEVARASCVFATCPGGSRIRWMRRLDLERLLVAPYRAPLPRKHYADQFEEAMVALAKACGLRAEVEKTGEWEVFEE